MDPLGAQVRLVYFFDTPDLALESRRRSGARAPRGGQGRRLGRQAATGRARPTCPRRPRSRACCMVEVDAMPGRLRLLGVAQGRCRRRRCRTSPRDPRRCASCSPRSSAPSSPTHAPEGIGFEDLSILGPIFVLKLKAAPPGFARKMVVELWLYPDGTRILELSTKCAPPEAFQVAAESRAFLAERDIKVGGAQTTKTRKALEFFSKQLRTA